MKANIEPLIRFIEHLPRSGDIELSLLKCHLLIEEVLTRLILRSAKHPEHIFKARLTFQQKTSIVRGLCDFESKVWVWDALSKLNSARNELSHGLSVEVIGAKVDDFILFVEREHGVPDEKLLSATFGHFHWAAFKLFTQLVAYAHFDPTSLRIGTAATLLTGTGQADDTITLHN